jgi:uncharacterized membrane protein
MKKKLNMKNLFKKLVLILYGGCAYVLVELIYRGYSHPSMFLVGGICFVGIGEINEFYPWDMPLISQMFISSVFVTAIEFISGCILNLWLKLGVWDYSQMPYNLCGQICLLFSIWWFFLSFIGIFLDDYIRWKVFNEEKPRYHIFYSHCEDKHTEE